MQGGDVDIIARDTLPSNDSFFYDPRPKRAVIQATIPLDVLSRLSPGEVAIRAVAEGRSQFLRVPPPEVSEAVTQLDGP